MLWKGLLEVGENHAVERFVTSEGKSCFRKVCCKGGKTML